MVIIALILLFSAVFYVIYNSSAGDMPVLAEIIINGNVCERVRLDKDNIFSLPEKPNIVFQVHDGGIRFSESDCPDKICVNTGFISIAGQTAVCLPNKISIRIIGSGGIDSAI